MRMTATEYLAMREGWRALWDELAFGLPYWGA